LLELSTSFGTVRKLILEDANSLAYYGNNLKIWNNLRDTFPHPYQVKDAYCFIEQASTGAIPTTWAITKQGEAIGVISIKQGQDIHKLSAELGYWLAEPYWGKGYMTETVQIFCSKIFVFFGLARIFATVCVSNQASSKVLEKAGFTLEGILRYAAFKNGILLDQYLYAKTCSLEI